MKWSLFSAYHIYDHSSSLTEENEIQVQDKCRKSTKATMHALTSEVLQQLTVELKELSTPLPL